MRSQTLATLLTMQSLGLVPLAAQTGSDQAPGEGVWRNGGRLTASGKGESMPAADNATAEGRQQNRRVVLRLMR